MKSCLCAHPDDEHWNLPPGPCIHAACGCDSFRKADGPVTAPTRAFDLTDDSQEAAG